MLLVRDEPSLPTKTRRPGQRNPKRNLVGTLPRIWSLDTFSLCRRHLVMLERCCPYCGKPQPFVPPYPDLGICSHCRRPLGGSREPQEVSEFQRWIADALARMIKQQSTEGFPGQKSNQILHTSEYFPFRLSARFPTQKCT